MSITIFLFLLRRMKKLWLTPWVGAAVAVCSLAAVLASVWPTFPAVPGTYHCGARNAGSGELSTYDWERDKLLVENEVDSCCLKHDYCDRAPFDVERTKRSIAVVPGFFVGECSCDDDLLDCLLHARPKTLATVVRGIFSLSICYQRTQGDGVEFEWLLWRTMKRRRRRATSKLG